MGACTTAELLASNRRSTDVLSSVGADSGGGAGQFGLSDDGNDDCPAGDRTTCSPA